MPATLKPKCAGTCVRRQWIGATANHGHRAEHVSQESLMPPAENVIKMKPQQPVAAPPRVMPRPENVPVAAPLNRFHAAAAKTNSGRKASVQPVRRCVENPRRWFQQIHKLTFSKCSPKAAKPRFRSDVEKRKCPDSLSTKPSTGICFRSHSSGFFSRRERVLHWTMNILTIAAAFAAALIPILFFARRRLCPKSSNSRSRTGTFAASDLRLTIMKPAVTRVLMVRHGATVLSVEDRFAGATDVAFSVRGANKRDG